MDDLITVTAAAERAGVTLATLRRMLKSFNVTTYRDPRDARVRLVKAADIDALLTPIPEQRPNSDQTPTKQ